MKKLILFCIAIPSIVYCMESSDFHNEEPETVCLVQETQMEEAKIWPLITALVKQVNISSLELTVANNFWIEIQNNITKHGMNVYWDATIYSTITDKQLEIGKKYPNLEKAFLGVVTIGNIQNDQRGLTALQQIVPKCICKAAEHLNNKKNLNK